jgi:choline-glycine betaine transporter
MGKRIIIEIVLCLVAGGLLAILNPTTLLTWGLAVWMLFLVQALYFVFFDAQNQAVTSINPDLFEYAREQAENILANHA